MGNLPHEAGDFRSLLALGLVAAALSWGAGFGVLALLRRWQVLDQPNERSSHHVPTPRGGGLAMLAVLVPGALALAVWLDSGLTWLTIAVLGILSGVSFWDDQKPLPWWLRLGVHLAAALIIATYLAAGPGLENGWLLGFIVALLAGYASVYNFMDGINGLVATHAVICSVGLAVIAMLAGLPPTHPAIVLSILLGGVAAGFIPHNFPRARMFMGDVGSISLGFLLMLLTVWLACDVGGWLWLSLACLHTGFIMDTSLTMLRRALRGDRLHVAHREHFYQRLIRAGWTHQRVTTIETALQFGAIVLAAWSAGKGGPAAAGAVAVCVAGWLGFFAVAEGIFRRQQRINGV